MSSKPLYHPMTSHKITQGGKVGGKKNETVQYKISGVRSKWKLTRYETRNSQSLILGGVCCAINPFKHVLVHRGVTDETLHYGRVSYCLRHKFLKFQCFPHAITFFKQILKIRSKTSLVTRMEKEQLSFLQELLKNLISIRFLEESFTVSVFEKPYQSIKCSNNQTNSTIGHNLQTRFYTSIELLTINYSEQGYN